ncbi:MAG: 50S ribosomal protein L30 [Bacteroidia bacterium]|nr:50S ribosomal protein L30 [Bacteroidia bacterium]
MSKIKVTKIRSTIGQSVRVERNMEALGLNKINSSNELTSTPQIEGIIRKVKHLIKIENI